MKKSLIILLLIIIAGLFSFNYYNREGNKVIAEYLLNNQREVLYKKLINKGNIRIKNRLLDSIWFSGVKYVVAMPESLTEPQELALENLLNENSLTSDNTVIAYLKDRPDTLLKSFYSLVEKENVGFHFVLPPAKKEIHILDITRTENLLDTAYYLRLNRKF